MLNKICLVTGATSGIGFETARALAERGASVIIVGRKEKKCITSVNRIKAHTGNTQVEYLCADLSALKQVRELAETIKSKYNCIDVLINNAGAYYLKRYESNDGHEMTLALNYLSPFLLTSLLINELKKSEQGRIINVSSGAHYNGTIDMDDLQSENNFQGFAAYAQSKLALILFTNELARRLGGTKLTVNAVHPGLVATNFGKNNGWIRFYVRRLLKRNEISVAEGAETCIYMATSPDIADISGGYFEKNKQVKSSEASYNEGLAKKLWRVSENLTGSTY